MFVVLQGELYRRRIAERFRRAKPSRLMRVPVPCGAPFYRLTVPYCCDVSPRRIIENAPPLPLLLPDGFPVEEGERLRTFAPRRLPLVCAAYSVSEYLCSQRRPARNTVLGVFDPGGALCGKTGCLLPSAGDIRIVCTRPAQFDADVRHAIRNYGAPLTVGDDPALLRGCSDVLCVDPATLPGGVTAKRIFCMNDGLHWSNIVCLTGFHAVEPYASLCPPDVNTLHFAAALYELCGVGALEQSRFTLPLEGKQNG